MTKETLKLELEAFQGPFDLLLHLIQELKVDINDIPMTEITQQYLHYLKSMQELELDIAGEYLVMAATLLEIKSRMLLPIEPVVNVDTEYQGDPREILVQQLLIYQQFQYVTTALEMKEVNRSKLYTRPADDLAQFQEAIPLLPGELSIEQIAQAFQTVLEKVQMRLPKEREIEQEPLTIAEKIKEIQQIFQKGNEKITFQSLLKYQSRNEIITTFMAILEMVRKHSVIFYQPYPLADIELKAIV